MNYRHTYPIGSLCLVVPHGDEDEALLARVVANKLAPVVVVEQRHPLWHGARLNPQNSRILRLESLPAGYLGAKGGGA
ncbi:MAG: hypothetical protein L0Z50_20915 [Verrucomicrobiales bacterium]|nr:hypothetical protein [Verrucomicrobiales bacterium]